ncbi:MULTISPECIES: MoaD/ThiS family protein [Pontibacter]|uniref:Molybdopterin synthase sulfur carrier subunit n=1 Tax=Pontibacter lucknowensis TaxID=1077936 RepID=A0A1N6W3H9_9BACT|nr:MULTISPECIES: MoaD/ThiS family protein [Pontibacter]EJF07999.1 sulfur transfer protein ThiS [Pontibacter sp. BAB1700]SIQ84687.1 molybdopterin synthase sulfur carrier subunit [Pontibacter lucknowensis]
MKVKVLAFGIAKDIFGSSSTAVELSGEATVEALRTALEMQYPRLKQLSSFMIAVNDEYAEAGQELAPEDEVAIIPPVSGG